MVTTEIGLNIKLTLLLLLILINQYKLFKIFTNREHHWKEDLNKRYANEMGAVYNHLRAVYKLPLQTAGASDSIIDLLNLDLNHMQASNSIDQPKDYCFYCIKFS